jgi:TonB family protein
MLSKNYLIGILVFLLALFGGILSTRILPFDDFSFASLATKVAHPIELVNSNKVDRLTVSQGKETGSGSSSCNSKWEINCFACKGEKYQTVDEFNSNPVTKKPDFGKKKAVRIISKPSPEYTSTARAELVEGTVILRITFLSNGQLGNISPLQTLPFGLTEKAIEAARRIKFEPAIRNGKPVSVTKTFQYRFEIY